MNNKIIPKYGHIYVRENQSGNISDVYKFIYGNDSISLNCQMAEDYWDDYEKLVITNGLKLKTLESDNETQIASINDYIIKGIKGEFYPCKPDIFEMTYDKV